MNGSPPVTVVGTTSSRSGGGLLGRVELLTAVLLATITFAHFLPALNAEFLSWDDYVNISLNQHIRGLNPENLRWMFADTEQAMRYKPLSWLSWAILYAFARDTPWPYHAANLILHSFNTALVFLLIQRLFERKLISGLAKIGVLGPVFCSAIGALLWGLHPLRTEPVAWATGLPYCQSVFFVLLSLHCYLHAQGPRRRAFLWASLISFSCALFTYPLVLGYPAVLFVLDSFRLPSKSWLSPRAGRVWLEKLPFAAMSLLFVAIAVYARFVTPGIFSAPVKLDEFGLASRFMQALYVWAYYFWKPWIPFDLSPVYTTLVSFRPTDWMFLASAAFIVLATSILFLLRERCRLFWGLWLCHLVLLVPVLGLTEHPHYPSDRYSYLASICWSILIAAGLGRLWALQKHRWLIVGAACGSAVVVGVLSHQQARIWQNDVALFEHILQTLGDDPYRFDIYPRLARSHDVVGWRLFGLGRRDEAKGHFLEAMRLAPLRASGHVNLGIVLEAENKTAEALDQYREALRLDPTDASAHTSLGIALARENKLDEAILHFSEALRSDAENPVLHRNFALAQSQKARSDEAKRQLVKEKEEEKRGNKK